MWCVYHSTNLTLATVHTTQSRFEIRRQTWYHSSCFKWLTYWYSRQLDETLTSESPWTLNFKMNQSKDKKVNFIAKQTTGKASNTWKSIKMADGGRRRKGVDVSKLARCFAKRARPWRICLVLVVHIRLHTLPYCIGMISKFVSLLTWFSDLQFCEKCRVTWTTLFFGSKIGRSLPAYKVFVIQCKSGLTTGEYNLHWELV